MSRKITDTEYLAKILSRCEIALATGCWEWQGFRRKPPRHYGDTPYRGRNWRTHRLMWHLVKGPIPDGMVVMHTCDNPPCCNPDHLRLGTHKENMADCRAKDRYYYANLTHCKHGHEFTPENTSYRPGSRLRQCKTCQRIRQRILAGWPEDLAMNLPPTPTGKKPINKSWAVVRNRKLFPDHLPNAGEP